MGGWPMDDHPPGGFDRSDLPPNTVLHTPEPYDIPLRSLYSRNVANLMMAGRNISATHAAFTSSRVMATCAGVGQAAGLAAAICTRNRITPRQLAEDKKLVSTLQQKLLRDDQSMRYVRNTDPADLARQATLSASGGDPKRVIDGVDRDYPENKHTKAPAEKHAWEAPLSGGPAWLELAWTQPQSISEVILKFDSGFQRELTLTASDSHTRGTVREPQPETVRDYTVSVKSGSEWKTVADITGNHQRLNKVKFAPVNTSAVRIEVRKTNGIDSVRLFEVRCYG
jgi:hypothetical protein